MLIFFDIVIRIQLFSITLYFKIGLTFRLATPEFTVVSSLYCLFLMKAGVANRNVGF